MSYSYYLDRTTVGDLTLMHPDWKTLHYALLRLHEELMSWNQKVGDGGAKKIPYEQEVQDLYRIITSISKKLKYSNTHGGLLTETGVSVGSHRLKKAALILLLCRRYENLEEKKGEGWPSAALDSLNEEIKPIIELLKKQEELLKKQEFGLEPHDVLWQLISKRRYEEIIDLKQDS